MNAKKYETRAASKPEGIIVTENRLRERNELHRSIWAIAEGLRCIFQ